MGRLAALKRLAARRERGDDESTMITTEFGRVMVERSIPMATMERLKKPGPYGLVVLVPSEEHVQLVGDALEEVVPVDGQVFQFSSEPIWTTDRDLADLLRGERVAVAVTCSADLVPKTFGLLADATISVPGHDSDMVRQTMRNVLGKFVPKFPSDFVVHPDPIAICSCILPKLSVERIIVALTRLGSTMLDASEPLPDLHECVEFGDAQRWGLQVRGDIAAWRAGALPASDLDSACLLVSPPGHGKTYFARVLARSMKAPLFQLTLGSTFLRQGYLGDVIQSLRAQFAAAAAAAPSVLLLDELDGFGRRDAKDHNSSFMTNVINELLTLIDGASVRRPGLVIVGATNIPHAIDPALRRPGRLSRTIRLPLPDAAGRENVLRFHLRDDVATTSIDKAVRLSTGFTSARLMQAVKSARQLARAAGRPMNLDDLHRAISGEDGGEDELLLHRVALHEAGHALAALLLPDAPRLHSMTLQREGDSPGGIFTTDQAGAVTRSRIDAKVVVALAGRAAEVLVHGDEVSDGARSDLRSATGLIADKHAQLGMGGTLRHHPDVDLLLSNDCDFAAGVEAELQQHMANALALLAPFRPHLHALAQGLLEARVLSAVEAARIVEGVAHPKSDIARQMEVPGVASS